MVRQDGPDKALSDVVRTGMETLKSVVDGVTSVIRQGDSTIRDLDSALTGGPSPDFLSPEQSFLEVVALMQAAMDEAKQKGSANSPAIMQRAREILGKVTKAEPAWRPAPAMLRTVNDVIRVALRDLRGSQNLFRLAQGNGSLDDLDSLTKWADDISDRVNKTQQVINKTQQVIAQPKPAAAAPEPVSEPQAAVLTPVPVVVKETKPKKKKNTTPKKKANPEDIAFAKAVAEEMGDTKVKDWAQQFADGKLSEKQWINRLTNHAAAARESLDDVFARAADRIAKESNGK